MVFQDNNGPKVAMHIMCPDLVPPIVVPTVNATTGFTNLPTNFNVFFTFLLAKTVATRPALSVGDVGQPVSGGQMLGPSQDATFQPGMMIRFVPGTKMTAVSLPDFPVPDGVGIQIAPGQVTVINLKPI